MERQVERKVTQIPAGEHVIGSFVGDSHGPTLVAVGSLHGNEPAGAAALIRISQKLEALYETDNAFKGRVYLLAGNTRALNRNVRYIDSDLNRHWTAKNLSGTALHSTASISEDHELRELDAILDHILVTAEDEVYVLDLHSTSAAGIPFATVGDTLRNRKFAQKFAVRMLLGIEEQLDGTLLEYLNNTGAVTLGFEGGQHDSLQTIDNHESIVWLGLVNSGVISPERAPDLDAHQNRLAVGQSGPPIFEVRYRHAISEADDFVIDRGFNNFDDVKRGQIIAKDRNGPIMAVESGVLLMPLYQKLGQDGFFIGRRVAGFWLWLSALLRGLGIPAYVDLLPGVRQDEIDPETMIVDTRVARLFPLQVFHLLGYRKRRWSNEKLIVSRRKHDSLSPFRKTI